MPKPISKTKTEMLKVVNDLRQLLKGLTGLNKPQLRTLAKLAMQVNMAYHMDHHEPGLIDFEPDDKIEAEFFYLISDICSRYAGDEPIRGTAQEAIYKPRKPE